MIAFDPIGDKCLRLQAGTDLLQRALLRYCGVTDLGTYYCRTIAGSTKLSFHAEGRAGDNGGTTAALRAVADLLVEHAEVLGVQEVIFFGRIWRSHHAPLAWREYTGADMHLTHVHWALNWAGAHSTDSVLIDSTIGGAMPLTPADLDKIGDIVDARIVSRLGHLGVNEDGQRRKSSIVNACVRAIEAMIKPEFLRQRP